LKYDLIQRGFLPATAASVVTVFRRSIEFSGYFDKAEEDLTSDATDVDNVTETELAMPLISTGHLTREKDTTPVGRYAIAMPHSLATEEAEHDRIPVRLSGGRRAWLSIPTPFFTADKQRLKAQIDLLLTAEDDENVG
jgi:hypothetical protein